MLNRYALNDLSHQNNLNLQTPVLNHHKLCNSAQQNKHTSLINSNMPMFNTSFKNSQIQSQQSQQSQQKQQHLQQQPSFQLNNQSSQKETPFFTNSIKNTTSVNMFGQSATDKENLFSASRSLQQTEPVEQKFGGSYQIFESMIEDGIKDIQCLFNQNDTVNREQQRRAAFGGCIDMHRLETAILQGQSSDYEIYVDHDLMNNFLQIQVPSDLFDEESAIKKSLSALNEDFTHLNSFNMPDINQHEHDLLDQAFYDQSEEHEGQTPTKEFEDKLFFN